MRAGRRGSDLACRVAVGRALVRAARRSSPARSSQQLASLGRECTSRPCRWQPLRGRIGVAIDSMSRCRSRSRPGGARRRALRRRRACLGSTSGYGALHLGVAAQSGHVLGGSVERSGESSECLAAEIDSLGSLEHLLGPLGGYGEDEPSERLTTQISGSPQDALLAFADPHVDARLARWLGRSHNQGLYSLCTYTTRSGSRPEDRARHAGATGSNSGSILSARRPNLEHLSPSNSKPNAPTVTPSWPLGVGRSKERFSARLCGANHRLGSRGPGGRWFSSGAVRRRLLLG